MKIKKPLNFRVKFAEVYEKIQSNIPLMIITSISTIILMAFIAFTVFFINAKGPEKVLVPNVIGKSLEDALLEMQVNELYPKINLRYSDVPGDEGTILEQNPKAQAIVKGYSRVNLVVSRGVIIDKVDDYTGMKIDDVQLKIQTLFAGQSKPLIVLANPKYIPDPAEAGTVLEQDPPAGTTISEPVTVNLIVSRGPYYENTRVPNLIGQSVNDLLQTITRSKLVFDISSHKAEANEKSGTVTSQQTFDAEFVPNYTRMTVEMAISEKSDEVIGIFTENISEYPYPVPLKLDATPSEGTPYTIVSFNHPGGLVTIPYSVPHGTTLSLSVVDKVVSKKTVN